MIYFSSVTFSQLSFRSNKILSAIVELKDFSEDIQFLFSSTDEEHSIESVSLLRVRLFVQSLTKNFFPKASDCSKVVLESSTTDGSKHDGRLFSVVPTVGLTSGDDRSQLSFGVFLEQMFVRRSFVQSVFASEIITSASDDVNLSRAIRILWVKEF